MQKALFSLVDFSLKPYGVLRIKNQNGTLYFDLSRARESAKTPPILIVDNGAEKVIVTDIFTPLNADFGLENLAVLVVENSNPVAFSKRGSLKAGRDELFEYYLSQKSAKTDKSGLENAGYNDEAIATENYYLKEGLSFEGNPLINNANAKTPCAKNQQEAQFKVKTDQEHVYKPSDYKRGAYATTQSGGISCETSQSFFARRYQGFLSGLNLAKRFSVLEDLIPNSKFYPSKNAKKPYLVGIIYDGQTPKFLAYAVEGVLNKNPRGFERGYFIPSSYFDKEKGFFVILQDALTGANLC